MLFAPTIIAALLAIRLLEMADGSGFASARIALELPRTLVHLALFALALALVWRPVLALVLVCLAVAGLLVANRVKKQVLQEPVVFSDLALIGQILRHPQLYFVSLPGLALLAAVAVGIIVAASWLEPADPRLTAAFVLAAALLTALAWWRRAPALSALRHDLLDQSGGWGSRALGLPTALVLQWLSWQQKPVPVSGKALPIVDQGCDLVAIQLESFVDMGARLGEPSPFWSRLQARSALYGRLAVGVRGANTMRTEHAVLSGTANADLGFDRFDPYLRIASAPGAVPAQLRAQNWSTSFIHPNDIRFFRRHRAMPALGFGRLVGGEAFAGAERIGPYVSDAALLQQVLAVLHRAASPALVFAVSMENHGPWRAGRLPGIGGGVAAYREHLKTMEAALNRLLIELERRDRPTMLVLYGDHAPALAETADWADADTDYVIMMIGKSGQGPRQQRLRAEQLLPTALGLLVAAP